jgi:hypothetical protein
MLLSLYVTLALMIICLTFGLGDLDFSPFHLSSGIKHMPRVGYGTAAIQVY